MQLMQRSYINYSLVIHSPLTMVAGTLAKNMEQRTLRYEILKHKLQYFYFQCLHIEEPVHLCLTLGVAPLFFHCLRHFHD